MITTSLQQSCAGWPYVLRQHGGGSAAKSSSSHLHFATAGAGGGLALLAGAAGAGRGLQTMLPGSGMYCADEAELLLCGGPVGMDCGMVGVSGGGRDGVGGMAPLSLSLLARASPLRLEDSQLVMAVQALKSVEDSTNISLDEE
jgi:hypothetical protein